MRNPGCGMGMAALTLLLMGCSGSGGLDRAAPRTSASPSLAPALAGSPSPSPTMTGPPATPPGVVPGTRQPPQAQLVAAAQVATAFLVAYTTGPGCETDQQLVARLRPYLTQRLATELSWSAAPPCTALGPSVAHLTQLTSEGLAPDGRLGFIAQLEAAPTTTGQGEPVGLELFLVREPGGWRVDEVRQ